MSYLFRYPLWKRHRDDNCLSIRYSVEIYAVWLPKFCFGFWILYHTERNYTEKVFLANLGLHWMYKSCMATCDAFLKDASVNTSTWEIFTDIPSFSFMDDILSFPFSKHFELNTKGLYGSEPVPQCASVSAIIIAVPAMIWTCKDTKVQCLMVLAYF